MELEYYFLNICLNKFSTHAEQSQLHLFEFLGQPWYQDQNQKHQLNIKKVATLFFVISKLLNSVIRGLLPPAYNPFGTNAQLCEHVVRNQEIIFISKICEKYQQNCKIFSNISGH